MAESPKALPDVSGTPPPVRCEGEGLANAIVRQANSFQIIVPEHETNPELKLEDLHVHIHLLRYWSKTQFFAFVVVHHR